MGSGDSGDGEARVPLDRILSAVRNFRDDLAMGRVELSPEAATRLLAAFVDLTRDRRTLELSHLRASHFSMLGHLKAAEVLAPEINAMMVDDDGFTPRLQQLDESLRATAQALRDSVRRYVETESDNVTTLDKGGS